MADLWWPSSAMRVVLLLIAKFILLLTCGEWTLQRWIHPIATQTVFVSVNNEEIQEPQERMRMGNNNTLSSSSSLSVALTLGNVAGKQKNKVTPDTTDPWYRHKTVGAYYVVLCLLAAAERGWGERSFEAKTTTLAHTQTQLNWEGVCSVCVR